MGALAELVLSYICREVAGWADDLRDTQERLDFAERLLAEQREQGQIAERGADTDWFGR